MIKLATAPAIACYLHEVEQGSPRSNALDRLLAQLALPSFGQWVGMLRALAKHFGESPDAPTHPLGHLWDQLDKSRGELPGLLALYRRIKHGADGQLAGDQSCSLMEMFNALVQYRNDVIGHGGPRFDSFFSGEMGPLLFPAANEILADGTLDLLGPRGSRLVYVSAEQRQLDLERVEVGIRELIGKDGERAVPLAVDRNQAAKLAGHVAVIWPGWPAPLLLDPLLIYREGERSSDVLFLNRDLNGRQVQYLNYSTGRTERDCATVPALAALLSRVTGRQITEEQLDELTERSRRDPVRRVAAWSERSRGPGAGRVPDPGRDRSRRNGSRVPCASAFAGQAGRAQDASRRHGRRRSRAFAVSARAASPGPL